MQKKPNESERFPQSQCTLGMFAKRPDPGLVKSRLATDTSPEWAAQVADCFLRDLVLRLSLVPVQRVLVYSPRDSESFFAELVQDRFSLVAQGDGDLGQRLVSFLRQEFDNNAEKVVLVGMDSPTLPVEYVIRAFDLLTSKDVVIGPAADGGYYLIGCRQFVPELFENIDWSSEKVLHHTISQLKSRKLSLSLLPPWYDVDTREDWWMLRGHVEAMRFAGENVNLTHTEKLLFSASDNDHESESTTKHKED